MDIRAVAQGLEFPEGPVALADGSVMLVEIAAGAIARISPDGTKTTVARPGGGPNGAAIGPDGNLVIAALLNEPRTAGLTLELISGDAPVDDAVANAAH